MDLLSKIAKWAEDKLEGEIVADYGVISSDAYGTEFSACLRRQNSGRHLLVFKWEGRKNLQWQNIEATPEVLVRLEVIMSDARTRIADRPKRIDGQSG